MPVTLLFLVVIAAFLLTLASAAGKVPLWVAVFLLCIAELIHILPTK